MLTLFTCNVDAEVNGVNINVNSVHMTKKSAGRPEAVRTYHHGDARSALVAAGMRILGERTIDDVSLREVARGAGVSATAVYRHFKDKEALLIALSEEGFEQLADMQRAASAGAKNPTAAFDAIGQAYVRFATGNPALFRLMFSSHRFIDMGVAGDHGRAFAMLREHASHIAGGNESAAADIATRAWALVHGLATLMLDNQVRLSEKDIARLLKSAGPAC